MKTMTKSNLKKILMKNRTILEKLALIAGELEQFVLENDLDHNSKGLGGEFYFTYQQTSNAMLELDEADNILPPR